jgi:hypothetical protein
VVSVARFTSIAAAVVWVLGLPFTLISAAPFSSDATYFIFGLLIALLGIASTPIALAYPVPSGTPRTRLVRVLGAIACLALVLTGTLLAGGSAGLLGDTAPTWITGAAVIGLLGFFVWILLANLSTRRSAMGRWVFWLGIAASASILVPTSIVAVVTFVLGPSLTFTNATIPLAIGSDLTIWLFLPAWLVALAVRMRAPGK